jgi:hypothetical protein
VGITGKIRFLLIKPYVKGLAKSVVIGLHLIAETGFDADTQTTDMCSQVFLELQLQGLHFLKMQTVVGTKVHSQITVEVISSL